MRQGRDNEDDDGKQEWDSSGDLMGLKGGRRKHVKGQCRRTMQWILLPAWTVGTHGKELRVDSNSVLRLRAVETHGDKGRTRGEKDKAKLAKAGGRVRKERAKARGLQSVNEWDEKDQTEDHTSVPLLSMSCRKRKARNRCSRPVANSGEASDIDDWSKQWTVREQQQV